MKILLNTLIFFFFILLSFSSCKSKNFNYHDDSIRKSKILMDNHIHKITETRIEFDTTQNPDWKRIETIKFINDKGLNVEELSPQYVVEYPEVKHKKGRIPTLADLGTETNRYDGHTDTIYKKYNHFNKVKKEIDVHVYENGNGRLSSSSEIIEYEYDDKGNLVSTCDILENYPLDCLYTEYKYGDDGQIILRKDSSDNLPPGIQSNGTNLIK